MQNPRLARTLPPNPSIDQHKTQARELLRDHRNGDERTAIRLRAALPDLTSLTVAEILAIPIKLSDAQFAIAREHGFASWMKFKRHVGAAAAEHRARIAEFLTAATPDPDQDHRAGDASAASALLSSHPELPAGDIFTAAAVADVHRVEQLLAREPGLATAKGGPHNWEPLQYICFSRFLRLQPERTEQFVAVARQLLSCGANPNAYFMSNGETETVLYGAGGVARNPAMVRLLLESGANPNDADLEYHAAEDRDPSCLMLMVEFGLDLNRTGTSLLRKLDFEEIENVRLLLDAGANPNAGMELWGKTALHQAVMRGRSPEIVRLLVERGADMQARTRDGKTAYALAVRRGNDNVAELLLKLGANTDIDAVDALLAAAAHGDASAVTALTAAHPGITRSLTRADLAATVDAAATNRLDALRILLDAGFPITGPGEGEPTPLHQAAWHGNVEAVQLLLERGAPVDLKDKHHGGTPLEWAKYAAATGSAGPDGNAGIIALLENAATGAE